MLEGHYCCDSSCKQAEPSSVRRILQNIAKYEPRGDEGVNAAPAQPEGPFRFWVSKKSPTGASAHFLHQAFCAMK